jgi:hypothetical protein
MEGVMIISLLNTILLGGWLILTLAFAVQDPIMRMNCEKIRPGMTQAEVERILGPPTEAKNMRPYNVTIQVPTGERYHYRACREISESYWKGRSMTITVEFIEDGTVGYATADRQEEMLLLELARWIGLQ